MVPFDNAVTVGGAAAHDYYYDDRGRMLHEYVPDESNAQRDLYLWSPFYVNEMVLRSHWSEAGGGGGSESSTSGGSGEGGEDDLGGGDEAPIDWFLDGAGASGSEESLSSVSTETETETASTIELLYVQQDANYNVTSLTDTSGAVVARYVYDPYGAADAVNTSTWASLGGIDNDPYAFQYLFQGMRWEGGVGLYHSDTRDYSPTLGRWTGQDYLGGYVDGANLYQFVRSSPSVHTDPFGDRALPGIDGVRGPDGRREGISGEAGTTTQVPAESGHDGGDGSDGVADGIDNTQGRLPGAGGPGGNGGDAVNGKAGNGGNGGPNQPGGPGGQGGHGGHAGDKNNIGKDGKDGLPGVNGPGYWPNAPTPPGTQRTPGVWPAWHRDNDGNQTAKFPNGATVTFPRSPGSAPVYKDPSGQKIQPPTTQPTLRPR